MEYNMDYRKEIPQGAKPFFVKDKTCPKCNSKLVVLAPDRVWCENKSCDTGYSLLIGNGTRDIKTYQE